MITDDYHQLQVINFEQKCRWIVFRSVGELSQNRSVNCLKNRVGELSCRWIVLIPKKHTRLGSHKSGFVGKTKDYAGRDAQVGCRANARPPLSSFWVTSPFNYQINTWKSALSVAFEASKMAAVNSWQTSVSGRSMPMRIAQSKD